MSKPVLSAFIVVLDYLISSLVNLPTHMSEENPDTQARLMRWEKPLLWFTFSFHPRLMHVEDAVLCGEIWGQTWGEVRRNYEFG